MLSRMQPIFSRYPRLQHRGIARRHSASPSELNHTGSGPPLGAVTGCVATTLHGGRSVVPGAIQLWLLLGAGLLLASPAGNSFRPAGSSHRAKPLGIGFRMCEEFIFGPPRQEAARGKMRRQQPLDGLLLRLTLPDLGAFDRPAAAQLLPPHPSGSAARPSAPRLPRTGLQVGGTNPLQSLFGGGLLTRAEPRLSGPPSAAAFRQPGRLQRSSSGGWLDELFAAPAQNQESRQPLPRKFLSVSCPSFWTTGFAPRS